MRSLLLIHPRLIPLCVPSLRLLKSSVFWRLCALIGQLLLLWVAAQIITAGMEHIWTTDISRFIDCVLDRSMGALLGIAVMAVLVRFVALRKAAQADTLMGSAIGRQVRIQLIDQLSAAGTASSMVVTPSRLVRLASDAVQAFERFVGGYLAQLITHLAATLLVTLFLLQFSVAAAICMLAGNLLLLVLLHGVLAMVSRVQDAYLHAYDEVGEAFIRALEGLVTLKVYGAAAQMRRKILTKNEVVADHTLRLLRMQLLSMLIFDGIIFGSSVLAAWMALDCYWSYGLSYSDAVCVCLTTPVLLMPARTLVQQFHQAMLGVSSGRHIGVVMEELAHLANQLPWNQPKGTDTDVEERMQNPGLHTDDAQLTKDTPSLICQDMTVVYPNQSVPALHRCTCQVEGTGFVVIVGTSGSGKSTLLRTFMRELQPASYRRLELNGRPLALYQPHELVTQLAAVSHNDHIFAGTLRQNLTLYREATDKDLFCALGSVNLLDTVQARGGLDALVDPGGTNFSGGQRQRIACARTLLSPASVLLFDEPTSSVDVESEEIILHAMRQQGQKRLVICVTHNVTFALQADTVVVMDQGRVVATGSHQLLMDTCEAYKQLLRGHEQLISLAQGVRGGAPDGL